MIYDATVEVTCDNCGESVHVSPDYVYQTQFGSGGHYDCRDSAIETVLLRTNGHWVIADGKHFCGDMCRDSWSEE